MDLLHVDSTISRWIPIQRELLKYSKCKIRPKTASVSLTYPKCTFSQFHLPVFFKQTTMWTKRRKNVGKISRKNMHGNEIKWTIQQKPIDVASNVRVKSWMALSEPINSFRILPKKCTSISINVFVLQAEVSLFSFSLSPFLRSFGANNEIDIQKSRWATCMKRRVYRMVLNAFYWNCGM